MMNSNTNYRFTAILPLFLEAITNCDSDVTIIYRNSSVVNHAYRKVLLLLD